MIKILSTEIVKKLTMIAKVKDNDLKSGNKGMFHYSAAYKYKTAYKGLFLVIQCVDQWHGIITIWCNKIQ